MSPPCEDFLTAERLLEPEIFYPLDVRICDACLLVQLPAYMSGRGHLPRVRLLLVVQRQLGRARARVRRDGGRARRADPRQPRRRGRQQRRLPAPARRGARASRRSGIEPARNIAAVAASARHPDGRRVLRARRRAGRSSPSTAGPTASSPTTCSPTSRTSTTSRAGLATPARGRAGCCRIEVAVPRPAHRGQRVRHDLPRALHVLHGAQRREPVLARHGLRVLDVEELATHGARSGCGSSTTTIPARRPSAVEAIMRAASGRPGYGRADGLRRLRRAGRARSSATCSRS